MKRFIIIAVVFLGSCCKQTVTVYDLTAEEKEAIPYVKNSTFKWQTNNDAILNGKVVEVAESNDFDQDLCEEYYFGRKYAYLKTEQYKYTVSISKTRNSQIYFTIVTYNLDDSFANLPHFETNSNYLGFSTITFNNKTFTNAVKMDAYNADGNVKSTLIYSKTHGIEFILFEDGTWYKRVE